MPRLIVYAGPNGSGKSTIRDHGRDPVDVEIDPDRIARSLAQDQPGTADAAAGKEAIRLFRASVLARHSISLETTLTGKTVLTRMALAQQSGYDVSMLYVALGSADLNVARVAARVAQGGHHIPEDVIRRRVTASQDNLTAAIQIADHTKIHDNTGPRPRHLLTIEHGRIVFEAASLPDRLKSRMPLIRNVLAAPRG